MKWTLSKEDKIMAIILISLWIGANIGHWVLGLW